MNAFDIFFLKDDVSFIAAGTSGSEKALLVSQKKALIEAQYSEQMRK